ncbi:MAG: guanine deaminase, partial [Rubrivivax sp.]|nr:guanine deaminase [Rubrivivax sp.]
MLTPAPPSSASSAPAPPRLALRGDLLDFVGAPAWGETETPALRFRPDPGLLIEGGRIVGAQAESPDAGWAREDRRGHLVLPGFVDAHVHAPQIDMIA